MKTKVSHPLCLGGTARYSAAPLQAQAGCSAYVYDPDTGPDGLTREEYHTDPAA